MKILTTSRRELASAIVASSLVAGLTGAALTSSPAQAATTATKSTQAASSTVPTTLFGMNVNGLSGSSPDTGASAIRLWDEGVTWKDIEPQKNQYNFSGLDRVVSNAEKTGAADITYVLGMTPRWASIEQPLPPPIPGLGQTGTNPGTLHPDADQTYLDYVSTVVHRYRGRINSYQIWNEAELPDFYRGSPIAMANLTKKTYDLIKSIDQSIKVAGAGSVPRPGRFEVGRFAYEYLNRLRELGWPVDAHVVSIYPENADPNLRISYMHLATEAYKALGAGNIPVWESEMNYAAVQDKPRLGDYLDQALVARAYIDAQNIGISRSFWYSWAGHWRGSAIYMTTNGGAPTRAAIAYRTVKGWMAGRIWHGCAVSENVTRCSLDAGTRLIYYRDSGQSSATAPTGTSNICSLDGNCSALTAGQNFQVGPAPVLLKGAGAAFSAATTPTAPQKVKATGTNEGINVEWTASASDGGAPIMGYSAVSLPDGNSCQAGPTGTSCTIAGLPNGATYRVIVHATNLVGAGKDGLVERVIVGTPPPPIAAPRPTPTPASSSNGAKTCKTITKSYKGVKASVRACVKGKWTSKLTKTYKKKALAKAKKQYMKSHRKR
ncbi:MAG TPA: hypothetical protein DCQ04_03110 [Actinobacteria bacterium]|nr:hypothetical protein [Actinomycetota bacterium]